MKADDHGKQGSTIELPNDMIPVDITTFTMGTTHYVGILGTGDYGESSYVHQAWRIALNESGIPDMVTLTAKNLAAGDSADQCAASDDGEIFWVVGSGPHPARAWNTSAWGNRVDTFDGDIPDALRRMDIYVPEPPSTLTLVGLAAAWAVGFVRKRSRVV